MAETTKKKMAQRFDSPLLPRLMSLKDAARYMGMTDWALRELCWKGALPFVQFNGCRKWYFDRGDLDGAIERNKKTF
jgi:excisionase family DNA binding protein